MDSPPLCTSLGCKETAILAIATKNSNPTQFIRFCELHKPVGLAHHFWKVISLDESIVLEVIGS
jgi:hypothetical protein